MPDERWRDLGPEDWLIEALDHAGPRPPGDADQNTKRRWSERFADACAIAFADALRSVGLPRKSIKPLDFATGTEPLTPLGTGVRKRIDVTVVDPMLGLEIGVSLAGC
jgi:hypothetical protein